MSIVLLEAVSVLVISVILYSLVSGVSRWRTEKQDRPLLLMWAGLIGSLYSLNPGSRLFTVPFALVLAIAVWRYTKEQRFNRGESPDLLLRFSSYKSVALSGGLAGLMIVALLYTWGFLQDHDYWRHAGVVRAAAALGYALVAGSALGVARKYARVRWPNVRLWVPYTFNPGGGAEKTQEGEGFRVDELCLPLVITPPLWLFLAEIQPGWSSIFLFGLVLPSYGFYFLWAFFQTAWLRWIGVMNTDERAVHDAYEVLIKDQSIQPWLKGVTIEFDPQERTYVLSGTLPSFQEKATIKRRLSEIGSGIPVRDDAVTVDGRLTSNPWYERAIARRKRQKARSA